VEDGLEGVGLRLRIGRRAGEDVLYGDELGVLRGVDGLLDLEVLDAHAAEVRCSIAGDTRACRLLARSAWGRTLLLAAGGWAFCYRNRFFGLVHHGDPPLSERILILHLRLGTHVVE